MFNQIMKQFFVNDLYIVQVIKDAVQKVKSSVLAKKDDEKSGELID